MVGGLGSIAAKRIYDLGLLGIKNIEIYDLPPKYRKLKQKKYDIVWIASPTVCHLYHFNQFKNYSDNFIIEKPLSVSYSGIDSKISNKFLYKKKNIYVAYSYRHERGLQKLKEIINLVGKPTIIQMEDAYHYKKLHPQIPFNKYEGILYDDIHIINISRWLFGEPIKILYRDINDIDCRFGWLTKDNIRIHMRADCLRQRYKKRIEVCGNEGNLIWNMRAHELFFEKANPEEERRAIPYKHTNHLFEEVKYVVDCVKEGKKFEVNTFEDAKKDLEIIDKLKEN